MFLITVPTFCYEMLFDVGMVVIEKGKTTNYYNE